MAQDSQPFQLADRIAVVLSSTHGNTDLTETLRELADQSRHDLDVRHALAQEDVLRAMITGLTTSPQSQEHNELQRQTLRCIGNACAMNTDAIKIVCNIGMGWLEQYCIHEPSVLQDDLRDTIAGVIYNLLAADFSSSIEDSEAVNPALGACYNAGIHNWIMALLADGIEMALRTEDLVDMLFWLTSCVPKDDGISLPDRTINLILTKLVPLALAWPNEMLSTLAESLAALLRPQVTKAVLAERYDCIAMLNMLQEIEARIGTANASTDAEQAADLSVLGPQSSNLTWLLSDISAEPSFARNGDSSKDLLAACMSCLRTAADFSDQTFIASCLVVGNALLDLDQSEAAFLIQDGTSSVAIARSLPEGATPDVLFATAGLLTSLCRAKEQRERLGSQPGLIQLVELLCKSKTPQVSQAGLRLVRALGRECPSNQARLAPILESLPKPTEQTDAVQP